MAEIVKHSTVFDSDQQYLGGAYAKALLGATESAGNASQVLQELDQFITEVLDRLPRLESTLVSPRVPYEAKMEMLDKVLSGKVTPTFLNFVKVVSKHGRFNCIRTIQTAVRELYNEIIDRVDVQITTAQPLDEPLLQRLAGRLKTALEREVCLSSEIDDNLIGGLIVRVGDTIYDASVLNRLDRLRNQVVEQASQAIKQSMERFETNEV